MELLKDRSYYRQLSDKSLIAHAFNDPSAELAIVLAERLEVLTEENEAELEELHERALSFERDANRLDEELDEAIDKIAGLEEQIAQLEKEISECRTK